MYTLTDMFTFNNICRTGQLVWNSSEGHSRALLDTVWPRHYAALLEYFKLHGTCNVPQKERFECVLPGVGENAAPVQYNGQLGRWLANQRRYKRVESERHRLHPEREAMLQKLVDEG